jgi:hypothetical protein
MGGGSAGAADNRFAAGVNSGFWVDISCFEVAAFNEVDADHQSFQA